MEFVWPWAFWLLPLAFFARGLLPAHTRQSAALRVSQLSRWQTEQPTTPERAPGTWWQTLLRISRALALPFLLWVCLVTALARPYFVGDVVELPISGRDVMLAVDISGSMSVEDMQIEGRQMNRLRVVKRVVKDFVEQRAGDRIGLVLFGSEAYLQAPLTFDTRTVNTLLWEAQIGLAGKKTAIGDAIGLTVKRLLNNPENSRVMILLTDGDNTAGEIDPQKAAELAAKNSVKIYTIGFGADAMQVNSFFGSRTVNPSRDLDETALKNIAKATGGAYFRARDAQELERIYSLISALEPVEQDPERYRPQQHLFHWPLLAALVLSFLIALSALLSPWIAACAAKRSHTPSKNSSNQQGSL